MMRLDLEDSKPDMDEKHSYADADEKEDKHDCPLSTTKRRLLEAKQKDEFFDREVRAEETTQVVRALSRQFVADALSFASMSLASPRRNSDGGSSKK